MRVVDRRAHTRLIISSLLNSLDYRHDVASNGLEVDADSNYCIDRQYDGRGQRGLSPRGYERLSRQAH
jgi:CheY-like chemotaxis protein